MLYLCSQGTFIGHVIENCVHERGSSVFKRAQPTAVFSPGAQPAACAHLLLSTGEEDTRCQACCRARAAEDGSVAEGDVTVLDEEEMSEGHGRVRGR